MKLAFVDQTTDMCEAFKGSLLLVDLHNLAKMYLSIMHIYFLDYSVFIHILLVFNILLMTHFGCQSCIG
jgi:hypothetical protein